MYRNLLTAIALVFGLHSVADAQGPTVNRPTIPTAGTTVTATPAETDLGPVLAKMRIENKLAEGRNRIFTTKAEAGVPSVVIWATVKQGQITNWEAVDIDGNKLPGNTISETRAGVRKCKICYEIHDDGGLLVKKCIYVPCKDTPKAVTTGTAKVQ